MTEKFTKLRKQIKQYFDQKELKSLSFDLDILYEDLAGDTLEDKVRELINYCKRRKNLSQLIKKLHELRPNVDWIISLEKTPNSSDIKTEDSASPTYDDLSHIDGINILFDQAHGQTKWFSSPTPLAGYKSALDTIKSFTRVNTNEQSKFTEHLLKQYKLLILPTPFRDIVENSEYESVAKWVSEGGSLLVFGFYLMESHHDLNLNRLIRRFGFEFSHDLIMPTGKEDFRSCMKQAFGSHRDLWIITNPHGSARAHKLLKGINSIAFQSSCSIDYAANVDLVVSTASECNIMKAKGFKDESGRLVQIRDYYVDKHIAPQYMVALKHGLGKIIGIGSWKMFLNEFVDDPSLDNKKLFKNIIDWLAV